MKAEDVPQEWVDETAIRIAPYMGCQDCGTGPGECPCRDAARATLAAVAPVIAAREREACAGILDVAADRVEPPGAKRIHMVDRHTAGVLREKAAAIRARGEG